MDQTTPYNISSSDDEGERLLTIVMDDPEEVFRGTEIGGIEVEVKTSCAMKAEVTKKRRRGAGKKKAANDEKKRAKRPRKMKTNDQAGPRNAPQKQPARTTATAVKEVPENPPMESQIGENSELLKHKCRYCPRRCAQPAQLIRHETIHVRGPGHVVHQCPYCGAPYAFPMTLNYHIRIDHPGFRKYDY